MPLVPAAEAALRRALVQPGWRLRHAAAEALYAAGVARREAVATLVAGPRGEPRSSVEEAFSLDPLPPEILADLWAIAWQVAGVVIEHPRLVRMEVRGARKRIRRLVDRGSPVPAGLCDALWACVVEPGDLPERAGVRAFYAAVMPQDPAAGARLVGLLDHPNADRAAWSFGLLRCKGTLPASPPELWRWLDAGLRDPGRNDLAFELLDAIRGWLPVEQLRAAAGERFADALLAARTVPDPRHRATVIRVLAGWERERADVREAIAAALDDPAPTVRSEAADRRGACEERREALMAATRDPSPHVRRVAAQALLSFERRPDLEVTFWRDLLADPSLDLEQEAATRLGEVGAGDPDVVPTLVAARDRARAGERYALLHRVEVAFRSLAAAGVPEAIAVVGVERRRRAVRDWPPVARGVRERRI